MKKLFILPLFVLALISCNSEPSLQKYMAKNSENSNFLAVDLGADILRINQNELSEDEKKAFNSFKKLNIVAFKKNADNEELYTKEKKEVQDILKGNSQYEELFRFGSGAKGVAVYAVGKGENFDEVILFGSDNETGFLIARVLGKNMNPSHIMNLMSIMEKSNINEEQLKPIFEAMGNKTEETVTINE